MPVWSWLVAEGLYRDLVSAGVLVPIMHVMMHPMRDLDRIVQIARRDAGQARQDLEKKS